MTSALLVIDVQRGLCEGTQVSFESRDVIARINILSVRARAAGAPVVFVQHETPTGLFAHGSETWQLALDLHTEAGDVFVRKTASDAFHHTDMSQILQGRGVTDLVICGMHSEYCVDSTTRRAAALGYPVVLAADAHTTEDKAHLSGADIRRHENETLSNVTSYGVAIRAIDTEAVRFSG
mgnify:CR=1 FL=1